MGFRYDGSASMLLTSMKLAKTVIPSCLRRWEFWFFLLAHVGLNVAFRYRLRHFNHEAADEEFDHGVYITWTQIGKISSLTTFFLVFYSNECYHRYMELYQATRKLLGMLDTLIFESRFHLQEVEHQSVKLSMRFLVAALVTFFAECVSENGRVHDRAWEHLVQKRILTSPEAEYVQKYPGLTADLLLHWAAQVLAAGMEGSKTDPNCILDKVYALRDLQRGVKRVLQLPVPFRYFHLLNLMLCLNLSLWAYYMAMTDSVLDNVIFLYAMLIYMGMMELASQLSNPFGSDDVDFPLASWLGDYIQDAGVLLEARGPGHGDDWQQQLAEQQKLTWQADKLKDALDEMISGAGSGRGAGGESRKSTQRVLRVAESGTDSSAYDYTPLLSKGR